MDKSQKEKIKRINKKLIEFFGIPPRDIERPLPIDMLIATILSQNTNDKNSYKAYENLRGSYKSWDVLVETDVKEIEEKIRIAGLAPSKSKAIKNLVNYLYEKYGKVSLEHLEEKQNDEILEELTGLPGIGVKTSSCVLLFAMHKNVCPVDTHVHRTVNRIGVVKGSAPDKTFWLLNDGLPQGLAHSFHTNLIRLGREVCKPKTPACGTCPLVKMCKYEEKNHNQKAKYTTNKFMLLDNIGKAGLEANK